MGSPGNKTLPADGTLTPTPTVTVGDMQTRLENWLSGTRMMLGGGVETKTISGCSITGALPFILVETEAAAATDDLDFLVQTNYTEDGRLVVIMAANDARTVVVRHNITGSGKFLLANAASFSIDDDDKVLIVRKAGTTWVEVGRFFGADGTALRTYFGFGSAVNFNQGSAPGASPANLPRVDDVVGKQSFFVPVNQMMQASSSPAGAPIVVVFPSGVDTLQSVFADAADQSLVFSRVMPKAYDGGTISFEYYWSVLSASTNAVVMGLSASATGDNVAPVAYGTVGKVTDANNATLVLNVSAESGAITIAGTPANRKLVHFKLTRFPQSDAADNLGSDISVFGVRIFYTTNALNDN